MKEAQEKADAEVKEAKEKADAKAQRLAVKIAKKATEDEEAAKTTKKVLKATSEAAAEAVVGPERAQSRAREWIWEVSWIILCCFFLSLMLPDNEGTARCKEDSSCIGKWL